MLIATLLLSSRCQAAKLLGAEEISFLKRKFRDVSAFSAIFFLKVIGHDIRQLISIRREMRVERGNNMTRFMSRY